jgi:hypothetical protein
MRSSYIKNGYGDVFFALVEAFRPTLCVELGVLDGYSAIHLARGLKDNHARGRTGAGRLDAWDVFERYEFKHGDKAEVEDRMRRPEDLSDYVRVMQGDAFEVHGEYEDGTIHFLHVDIANDGERVRKILDLWDRKLVSGALLVIEGGTEERDREGWMVRHGKPPIRPEILSNPILNERYVYGTYRRWPGLTVALRKYG